MRKPSQYMWLIEKMHPNNDSRELTFSANTYPMKMDADSTKGVEFRHNGYMNSLFMDGHTASLNHSKLFGSGQRHCYNLKP